MLGFVGLIVVKVALKANRQASAGTHRGRIRFSQKCLFLKPKWLKSKFLQHIFLPFQAMPNYFRNLEETISSINPENRTFGQKVKFWLSAHLRFIWSLVMMLILFFFCIWISLKAGSQSGEDTIIETIDPRVKEVRNIDQKLEKAADTLTPAIEEPAEEELEELP